MGIRDTYQKYQKKLQLPDFDELNLIFDIESIEDDSYMVFSRIREKMHEKVENFIKMLQSVVQPETTIESMYETKYLDEVHKKRSYVLYKKLMYLSKLSNAASVMNTQEENAQFIRKGLATWREIQDNLYSEVKALTDLWEKETDIKQDLSYFG